MRLNSYRRASQVLFLFLSILGFWIAITGLIYPYFFCYACPGASAGCPLGILEHGFAHGGNGEWHHFFMYLLYLTGFVGTAWLVFGRGFCGWACPVGFLQDIFIGVKARLRRSAALRYTFEYYDAIYETIKEKTAGFSERESGFRPVHIKYVILLSIPITSYIFTNLFYTNIDPIGGLTATIPTLLLYWGEFEPGKYFFIKMLLTVLFFLTIIALGRAWCRFLCPLGAAMSPFNKISFLRLRFNAENCVHCNACVKKCDMKIDVPDEGERNYECILCGKCVDACKFRALGIEFLGKQVAGTVVRNESYDEDDSDSPDGQWEEDEAGMAEYVGDD